MEWTEFLSIFSDTPNGSSIAELFEFLQKQDQETLPDDLKYILIWHMKKKAQVHNISTIDYFI